MTISLRTIEWRLATGCYQCSFVYFVFLSLSLFSNHSSTFCVDFIHSFRWNNWQKWNKIKRTWFELITKISNIYIHIDYDWKKSLKQQKKQSPINDSSRVLLNIYCSLSFKNIVVCLFLKTIIISSTHKAPLHLNSLRTLYL